MRKGLGYLVALGLTLAFSPLALAQDDQDAGNTTESPEDNPMAPPISPVKEKDKDEPKESEKSSAAQGEKVSTKPQSKSTEGHGLFGPFRVGPTVSFTIPHLLNYGIEGTWNKTFGGGITFSDFSQEVEDIELGIGHWDVRFRWHPFQGSFFVGAAYGNQTLGAKLTTDLDVSGTQVPATFDINVNTTFLTPHLGWFATWDSGFTLGFELGYQMAMSADADDTQITLGGVNTAAAEQSEDYKKNKKDIEDQAELIGEKSLPYLALLKLGWML